MRAGLLDLEISSRTFSNWQNAHPVIGSAGVLRAATTFMRPDEMVVVAVGDAAKIKDALDGFSSEPVTVADQDGN